MLVLTAVDFISDCPFAIGASVVFCTHHVEDFRDRGTEGLPCDRQLT